MRVLSKGLRLRRNGAFAPGPNRGDPGPPPFYELELAASATGPFSPFFVALEARLWRDEKVRMRGGTIADVCVCRRPSP